ncbi:MAG: PKD domain-containing protein, partial [Chitinophagaceae bacterium]
MIRGKKLITGLIVLLPLFLYGQTVDFSFSTSNNLYCSPQQVTFTQQCSGTPDGFIWRFGNGLSGILPVDATTYTNPGSYSVTLIAIYAEVAISVTKTVLINPKPTVSLIADKRKMCQPGTVNFSAPGSPFITSYEWNFDDGTPVVITPTNTTSHLFNSYDNFIVTVKAISGAGCSSIASDTVTVERFSIINGSIDPTGGCIPATISLDVIPDPPPGDP